METDHSKHVVTKIFNQSFLEIFLINFLVMITFYSLTVAIGPYAVDALGLSQAVGGLLVGITVIGSLFARLSSGILMEKLNTKQILFVGAGILLISLISYPLITSLSLLVIMRFVQGIAIGLIGTITNTAIVLVVPPDRKSEGISYFSLSTIIATAFGPFLALILIDSIGFKNLFFLEIILGILVLAAIFMVHESAVDLPNKGKHQKISIHSFVEPKVLPIALVMLIAAISYSAIQSDLSFFMKSEHMAKYSSIFFVIYAVSILASRPFTGVLADKKNENYVAYPSFILLILGFVALSQVNGVFLFIVSAILIGVGFGNLQSTIQSTIAKMVPIDRLGVSTSTYFILFDLAFGIGPVILGIIAPIIGFKALFELMIFVVAVSLVLYYFVHGKKIQ
ncbi:MFS transporter [Pseudolactococcus insecticola]|uniref:MFS transporter n=1 Tax=Pseudolactococcus insecticola TaxID=2709158 RepID=A0A6A0B8B2_9LACT|nr:MFS transporter [Lactococcus insecticola]GFH40903.1 MFS transporter [Lactococcus insecticola]